MSLELVVKVMLAMEVVGRIMEIVSCILEDACEASKVAGGSLVV